VGEYLTRGGLPQWSAFSPDGSTIASGSEEGEFKNQ